MSIFRPQIICQLCKKSFVDGRSLKRHFGTNHLASCTVRSKGQERVIDRDEKDGKFHCPRCEYSDAHTANLVRHISMHPQHLDSPGTQSSTIPNGTTDLAVMSKVETEPLVPIQAMGCTVNVKHSLLICEDERCGFALDPKDIQEHIKGHGYEVEEEDVVSVVEEYGLKGGKYWQEKQKGKIGYVKGIKVTQGLCCVHEGCVEREKCYPSIRGMIDHCKAAHRGEAYKSLSLPCPMQSVFGHPKCYHRVTVPQKGLDLFAVAKGLVPDSGHRSFEGLQDPELGPFLQRTRWHEFLLQIQDSVNLFSFHQQCHAKGTEHPKLAKAIEAYVRETMEAVADSSTLHRRWVNTKGNGTNELSVTKRERERSSADSRCRDVEAAPFQMLRQEARKKYTDFFYQFVAYLMRCGPYEGAFKPLMERGEGGEFGSEAHFAATHLEAAKTLKEALESSEEEEEETQRHLHDFLWTVLTEELETDTEIGNFDYLPTQFLIGNSMEANGKIQDANHISPRMAKMQWVCRTVYFRHAILQKRSHTSTIK